MDTTLTNKFSFILDRNLATANCTENHVCTSCDKVVLGTYIYIYIYFVCIHTYMYPIIYITIASFIYISHPRASFISWS